MERGTSRLVRPPALIFTARRANLCGRAVAAIWPQLQLTQVKCGDVFQHVARLPTR